MLIQLFYLIANKQIIRNNWSEIDGKYCFSLVKSLRQWIQKDTYTIPFTLILDEGLTYTRVWLRNEDESLKNEVSSGLISASNNY